ncbi:MAG TPA: antibiotic biosynthesis monooxygenase, partial [Streptosporangiaceae bacterium]|nr:antibiotic biosynthesis monooxygenase [Streptosporangiaceae bacterium]
GGQVIAPLALILGLSEIAAKSTAARFCARLYIPALGLIAVVVLTLDQLAQTTFGKTWPDPAVVYGTPPNYVLEFAVGPATALIALIAVGVVLNRGGEPGWNAVLPAQLMGGLAALLLAYPALAALAAYEAKIHLPVASVFALLGTAAAVLTWLAGVRAARVPLPSKSARGQDAWRQQDERSDFGRFEPASDGGVYRGGGLYRPDQPGGTAGRRHDRDGEDADLDRRHGDPGRGRDQGWGEASRSGSRDWRDAEENDDWLDDRRRSDRDSPDFATGDFATGDFVPGDFAPGEFANGERNGGRATGWQSSRGSDDRLEPHGQRSYQDDLGRPDQMGGGQAGEDRRAQLFGQIAIFTLLEDRVEEFDQLTHRVVEQVRSRESDTLVFIVHAVPSAPMQRILYEVYRDRAAYERHSQQPHVLQFEADKRPYVLATNVIELGLQEAKVSPFPSVAELFSEPGYDTAGFERPDYLRDYGRTSARPGSGSREYR